MEAKVVAITGGASDIGLSLAKLLAKRGANVSIADVSEPNLEKAAGDIHRGFCELLTPECDVRCFDQVQSWLKTTVAEFGRLDGAADLAGVNGHRKDEAVVGQAKADSR